ncbi:MAG: hypothetical protein M1838_006024 [Thelocarpon superellum]|nr:MAG: hypothetical protein M1838_006024 [Thelocarpon superellum]
MAPHKRGPWCPGEDACLLQLVHSQGAHNWVRISHLIGTRSPKQCRERYHQNLKPALNHDPISPDEGYLIEKLVAEMGKRWAEIARRLNGRSDNAVKNWWNGGMNRRRRLIHRHGDAARSEKRFDERAALPPFPRPLLAADTGRARASMASPPKRHVDTPLPSPTAFSDSGRTDSADSAPSLMSDSASNFSTSPEIPASPAIELPPLIGTRAESRRPSLPILQLGSNNFVSDTDTQLPALAARLDGDRRKFTPHPSHYSTGSSPLRLQKPIREEYMPRSRGSPPSSSSASYLPSFCTLTSSISPLEPKDPRMNVSNLLV